MNLIDKYNQSQVRKSVPDIHTGDRVKVHQKIREGKKERIQTFEGVVIKVAGGRGINGSFTVRRIASGVGVEKSFPFHLPTIVKVEKLKSAKVHQSRIYFVRGLKGRAAGRMKKEKSSAGVWEDVVAEEKAETAELSQAELDAQKAAEKAESHSAEAPRDKKESEAEKILEHTEHAGAEESKKTEEPHFAPKAATRGKENLGKPHSAEATRDKQEKQPTGKDAGKPQAE